MSKWLFYAFDARTGQLTGGERSTINLVRGLQQRGITPVFVSQCEGPLAKWFQEEGVEVRIVPPPEILDVYDKKALKYSPVEKTRAACALLRYNRKIKSLTQEIRAQGIWGRGIRSVLHVGLAAQMTNRPMVWDIGVEERLQGLNRILHALGLLLSDRVITQARVQFERIFGRYLASWYSGSFHTFYPGISSDRAARLRESRTISEDNEPDVINVGSILPRKNQRMSLQAFKYVLQHNPDATLWFVGSIEDTEYAESLQEFASTHDLCSNVRFLGWRDDVPELLGRSSVLILSSHREGIPHVIREAMYAGIPVVSTAAGGVPEAVQDGSTGFIVTPGEPEEMGKKIDYLLSHPEERKRIGRAGLNFAQQRFSKEEWLSDYAELLDRLAK